MRALFLMLFVVAISSVPSPAQEKCGFGGEENFEKTKKLLEQTKTCKDAAATLHECAWGSSADNMFASIVIPKCEEEFRDKLTPKAGERYEQEMRLCGLQYAKQGGTMSISAAAMCGADTASSYAETPARWGEEPLRASFNCKRAKSKLENAICSNQDLGDADILLSRIYTNTLHLTDFVFSADLRNNQKAWLEHLPATCDFSHPTAEALSKCLLREYEKRFSMIDLCTYSASNETSWTASQYVSCLKDTSSLRDEGTP